MPLDILRHQHCQYQILLDIRGIRLLFCIQIHIYCNSYSS